MTNQDPADDAKLVVLAVAVVLGLLVTVGLWVGGNEWASSQLTTRPTDRDPAPWFYDRPTSVALGVATVINALILGRLWLFMLRLEHAARWYVNQQSVAAHEARRVASEQERARYGRTLR